VFEQIRIVISVGLVMLLLLLRWEAERFGAAEYDEPANERGRGTRLSWYGLGLSMLAALFFVHPQPHDVLYLVLGTRIDILSFGLLLALIGSAQAAGFALYRYGRLRLPAGRDYASAAVNDVATAVIDEATFRGALLGMLLAVHLPILVAVVSQTIVYAFITRLGTAGRHPYMFALSLGIGLACGWATIQTSGLGAAILGHAMTSFALFVCTGHAGQVPMRGDEFEEGGHNLKAPDGWQDARRVLLARAEKQRARRGAER
jgi:hypothetical protein